MTLRAFRACSNTKIKIYSTREWEIILLAKKLGEKFGFSDEVKAQVLVHLKKSHTWDIEDDEDKKTNQIAFEIAEKYNRPAHAESKNINELDKFLLNGK